MKNFFKKLSFVLAIAMVLTSLAPATASAAAKNYVKDSRTGKKVTAIYAYIGGSVATLTPYVNGKKASKVTIENSDPTKVDVSNKGVVTPLKNGTATLTFKSGKTTIAKVTVKARTRAKSLNIYDRAEYAAGKKEKLTEVALKVGETKDLQVTMPISKAAKKAGGKKSSYFAYAKSSNEDVVTVTKNDDTQRNFTVKAVAAGSAKVTIVANQKTEKNVKADKYYVEASFNVTVEKEAEFSAKQTGVKKITVTGKDLTAEVKDYTVKRGEVKVTLEKVELAEDKKSAVLVAASAKYPAGDYVVTFGALTSDTFKVEDGKATSVVVGENLVLSGDFGVATTGTISYKVLNQFEENITKTFTTINFTCTLGQASGDSATGIITVKDISTYYQLGTTGKVVFIATDGSGLNGESTVTLSSKSVPADVEVKGIFNETTNKYVDLKANTAYTGQVLDLVVDLKDQYGNTYTTFDSTASGDITLIVNPVLTNFSLASNTVTASYDWTLGGFKIPVTAIGAGNKLAAGTVTFTFVLKNAVKNISKTIEIAATAKVASVDIFPLDTVYQNDGLVKFGYTATDENGNDVKSAALLNDPNYGVNLPTGFTFVDEENNDVAVLYFQTNGLTAVPEGITGYYTQMVATRDYKFTKTISFNYSSAARPAYVLGVSSATGVVSNSSVLAIDVDYTDVKIADQYGREMNDTKKAGFGAYTVKVVAVNNEGNITSAGSITLGGGDSVTFTANATGSDSFKFVLNNGTEDVKNSEKTVEFACVDFAKLARFEVKEIGTLASESPLGSKDTRTAAAVVVYGYTNTGVKITVPAGAGDDFYTVESTIASGTSVDTGVAALAGVFGTGAGQIQSKDYDVTVKVNNGVGTAYTQKVTVKYETPVVKTVGEKDGHSYITIGTKASITVADITNELNAIDQFGYAMGTFSWGAGAKTIAAAGHTPSVLITEVSDGTAVDHNNTASATIDGSSAKTFVAKLTFAGGTEYTVKVVVE